MEVPSRLILEDKGKKNNMPDLNNKLGFLSVVGQDKSKNYDVEIYCIRSGVNRNNWNFQNVEDCYQSFNGVPILCAYVGNRIGDGHNMSESVDPQTGERFWDFTGATAERIVGAISENADDIRLEEIDGQTWVVAKGKLYRFYAKQLVDKIALRGSMEVSAETEIYEEHMDGDTEVYTRWEALGVTILGDGVAPAVPNANVKALAELQDEFKKLRVAAANLDNQEEDDGSEESEEDTEEQEVVEFSKDDDRTKCGEGDSVENAENAKTNESKGANGMIVNKKQLAKLAERFEGYTVLCAEQKEEELRVVLMSADGEILKYVGAASEQTIVPERIGHFLSVNACVDFGEDTLSFDVAYITDALSAHVAKLTADLKKSQDALEIANSTITSMENAENARRLNCAKQVVIDTLEKFNANRSDKVESKAVASIQADVEANKYTAMCSEDGAWIGDKAVEKDVLAVCATSVMESDRKKSESSKHISVWDKMNQHKQHDDNSVEALLDKWGL